MQKDEILGLAKFVEEHGDCSTDEILDRIGKLSSMGQIIILNSGKACNMQYYDGNGRIYYGNGINVANATRTLVQSIARPYA